jgi:hypothetical protein
MLEIYNKILQGADVIFGRGGLALEVSLGGTFYP